MPTLLIFTRSLAPTSLIEQHVLDTKGGKQQSKAATAALSLATYNTVQISKLETAIEAQEAKTDLLTDISKLHEAHLHQLQGQMDGIGNEIQVVKLFQEWEVRIESARTPIYYTTHPLVFSLSFDPRSYMKKEVSTF